VVVDALGDANESASAHHEPDEEPQPAAAQPDVEEPAPEKAKGKKKKLSDEVDEVPELETNEIDAAPEVTLEEPDNEYQRRMRAAVEEVATRVNELKSRVDELQDMTGVPNRPDQMGVGEDSETAALQARVDELEKLHAGTEPIGNRGTIEVSKTKDELIKEHLEAHPNDCPSTAVLRFTNQTRSYSKTTKRKWEVQQTLRATAPFKPRRWQSPLIRW
jgi:polyhydroxyalkanoate synthesis regulator phasin